MHFLNYIVIWLGDATWGPLLEPKARVGGEACGGQDLAKKMHKKTSAIQAYACIFFQAAYTRKKLNGGKYYMGKLEEMLLKNGLIYHSPDGSSSYIEGSLLSNTLVVRDSSGRTTHRIERASNGVDLIAVNTSTNAVDLRIAA